MGEKILLVESSGEFRNVAREVFSGLKVDTDFATDCDEAYERLKKGNYTGAIIDRFLQNRGKEEELGYYLARKAISQGITAVVIYDSPHEDYGSLYYIDAQFLTFDMIYQGYTFLVKRMTTRGVGSRTNHECWRDSYRVLQDEYRFRKLTQGKPLKL